MSILSDIGVVDSGGGGGASALSVTDLAGASSLDGDILTIPDGGCVSLGDAVSRAAMIRSRFRWPSVLGNGYVYLGWREDTGDDLDLDVIGGRVEDDGSTQCANINNTIASPSFVGVGTAVHRTGGWTLNTWVRVTINVANTLSNGTLEWNIHAIEEGGDGVFARTTGNALNVLGDWTADAASAWEATLIIYNDSGQDIEVDLSATLAESLYPSI